MVRFALLLVLVLSAAGVAGPAEATVLIFRNKSPDTLTVWADGRKGCTAAPGKTCEMDVRPGQRVVTAVSPEARRSATSLKVPANWLRFTIDYYDPSGLLLVQAGAFSVRANALRAQKKLAPLGDTSLHPKVVRGVYFLRVRVGPVYGPEAGDRLLREVRLAGFADARYVVEPGPTKGGGPEPRSWAPDGTPPVKGAPAPLIPVERKPPLISELPPDAR